LFVGIAPVVGVAVAYWLNVQAGALPACMPLFEGCISISATGRYSPGNLLFRAVLLPQAALLIFVWWYAVGYLDVLVARPRIRQAIMVFGVIGAIALVVYVTFLGTQQPFYEFMRRFGIYFYFLGTALSQILFTLAIPRSRLRTVMLFVIGIPFILGLINLALKVIILDSGTIENRIEWISALLMQSWFVLLYFVWRRSGFTVDFRTGPTNDRR
jgi:hypothetical protein